MVQEFSTALKPTQNNTFPLAFLSLLLGVFILSFAAIFTRLAENELSPSATIFNRYYIATVVLFIWQAIQVKYFCLILEILVGTCTLGLVGNLPIIFICTCSVLKTTVPI